MEDAMVARQTSWKKKTKIYFREEKIIVSMPLMHSIYFVSKTDISPGVQQETYIFYMI